VLLEEKLVENAAKLGAVLKSKLEDIQKKYPKNIGFAPAKGLVGGLLIVKPGTKEPDYDMAWNIINRCFQKGLMMFAPVGLGGGCVKIAPPLCINEEALIEGCDVIAEAIKESIQ
jgi:4-aminobutyrate aminotransferase-like enzyme